MSKSDIRDINNIEIPDVNWDAIESGALNRKEAWDIASKSVEFLINYRILSGTGFLKKGTKDEAIKVEENLKKLEKEYEGFHAVVRKTFADHCKEIAKKDGDSKTLFNRFYVLKAEALCYNVIVEWIEEKLQTVPHGMVRDFMLRVKDSHSKKYTYYLPKNWRNRTQKSIILILKDLERKARTTWMKEKGIEPEKRKPSVEEPKTEPKSKPEPKPKSKSEPKSKPKPNSTNSLQDIESVVPLRKTDPEKKKELINKKTDKEIANLDLTRNVAKNLSKKFGSLESLKKASDEEISSIPGIGKKILRQIRESLK